MGKEPNSKGCSPGSPRGGCGHGAHRELSNVLTRDDLDSMCGHTVISMMAMWPFTSSGAKDVPHLAMRACRFHIPVGAKIKTSLVMTA